MIQHNKDKYVNSLSLSKEKTLQVERLCRETKCLQMFIEEIVLVNEKLEERKFTNNLGRDIF